MVRGRVSLYLHHPSTKVAQISGKKDLNPVFPHEGKWEYVSEHPPSPTVWYAAKESHLFLTPSRILGCTDKQPVGGKKWLRAQQPRFSKGVEGTRSCSFMDIIRKLAYKLLAMLLLHMPPGGPQVPSVFHVPYPHILLPCSWLSLHALRQWLQAFADSWGACTESWPISMGLGESTQIWAFSTAVRKAREVWSSFLESREGIQF